MRHDHPQERITQGIKVIYKDMYLCIWCIGGMFFIFQMIYICILLSRVEKYLDMIYYDHYCPTFLVDNFSSRFKIVLLDQ